MDSLHQLRAHWIVSPARAVLMQALEARIAQTIAGSVPATMAPALVVELVAVALAEIDATIAKPIAVQANTIHIVDHRG